MPNKDINFANTLKKLREENKITQTKLASMLEIDQTAISKYERGIQLPEVATLIKIADVFGVSLDKLIYDVEAEAKATIKEAIELIGDIPLEELINANILTVDGEKATPEEIKRAIQLTKLDRQEG